MKPVDIISTSAPENIIATLLSRIHSKGPVEQEDLETLAYLKHFWPDILEAHESRLMFLLGLFHKTKEPEDILSLAYSTFRDVIQEDTRQLFTPVQASIRKNILQNRYFSFSAPTSSGKSFLLRDLIKNEDQDVLIVVPSRALIAEYLLEVREILKDKRDVLVLQFVDDINKQNTVRRVFVVTPERGAEVLKAPSRFNISLFLFDEAQISEEKFRGISFDSFVRRVDKAYPTAKKVFAHPFVENPEAQLNKHGFLSRSRSATYRQGAVGKIYLWHNTKTCTFECFSPFLANGHRIRNRCDFGSDIVASTISGGGSVLIYISKAAIYDGSFKTRFMDYIKLCDPIESPSAIEIVDSIQAHIGASGGQSDLVKLMRLGVVVHHGSIPLSVRFQIENFTKLGFARICFSTSTLVQGVNMPFDVVWVENLRFQGTDEDRILGLKNLIGRAGRTSLTENFFDYGFVIVENIADFVELLTAKSTLSNSSVLDEAPEDVPTDFGEFVEAVRDASMVDEYNVPATQLQRLVSSECQSFIRSSLDHLFIDDELITGTEYRELPESDRNTIKNALKNIYAMSLGRALTSGEQTVLSTSITILLWHIQGKAFREVLALRYGYLAQKTEQKRLARKLRSGVMSEASYHKAINALEIRYSAIPHQLPKWSLKKVPPSRFGHDHVFNLNYDLLVYDTYDYLDKVISFSLSDVFVAAYGEYHKETNDERASAMVNYIRYGTNDNTEIWLLRYGFSFEDIELIKGHVISVDENEIVFAETINGLANNPVMAFVERYL